MSNGILPLTATVTGIAFDCIDDAIFHSFYNTGMVCGTVLLAGGAAFIPIKEDYHTGFRCFAAFHPLTVGFEPIHAKGTIRI